MNPMALNGMLSVSALLPVDKGLRIRLRPAIWVGHDWSTSEFLTLPVLTD